MPKISVNVSANLLNWYDRFTDNGEITRTETIEIDSMYYITLLKQGMREVISTLTYDEFVCLLGGFNSTLYSGRETPGTLALNMMDYIQYEPEFAMNIQNLGVSKEVLVKKIEGFTEVQWYGLLEWARRFWHQGTGEVDEVIKNIGLEKELFAK